MGHQKYVLRSRKSRVHAWPPLLQGFGGGALHPDHQSKCWPCPGEALHVVRRSFAPEAQCKPPYTVRHDGSQIVSPFIFLPT